SDEQWLAVAGGEQRAHVVRVGSTPVDHYLELSKEDSTITQLAFSPDGRQVACAAIVPTATNPEMTRIFIYDFASKKIRRELVGHPTGISRLAFSPDGALLASGSSDTTVLVWRAGLRAFAEVPSDKPAT